MCIRWKKTGRRAGFLLLLTILANLGPLGAATAEPSPGPSSLPAETADPTSAASAATTAQVLPPLATAGPTEAPLIPTGRRPASPVKSALPDDLRPALPHASHTGDHSEHLSWLALLILCSIMLAAIVGQRRGPF